MKTSKQPDPIRVGVIGTGQIGKSHVENYSKIPNAQIVAVADLNITEAKRVASLYKIPHAYEDFRELLARDDIDAVDVCLHNNFHMPMTVAALKAGKHVYCEKPMAGSYHDAQTMFDTARQLKKKLSIQLFSLFTNETRVAKLLIEEGQLGEVYHARSNAARRRGRPFVDGYGTPSFVQKKMSGGGALYDMGVYHIAQVLHLLANPKVARVSGKTYQKTGMDSAREKESGYNVEEMGLGFVRFESDMTLDITEAWAMHMDPLESSFILGSKAGIRLEPFGLFQSSGDLDLNSTINLADTARRWKTVRGIGDVYDSSQHHWIAALQGRVDLLPTDEIALNTMLITEGIYLSSKLGYEVTADEIREKSKSTAVVL